MRFPEFDGEWEKYNVSDILNTFPTNSLSWDNLSYKCGKTKNIHYGLIHNGFDTTCVYTTNKIIPFIKDVNFPLKHTLLKTGDLILADASENRKDVGRSIEIINDISESIISGLHTIHARDKSNRAVLGFKGFYFQSKSMKLQIYRIANGSKIYGISPSNFKELHICLPNHLEQEKIVGLLRKIEDRIQTQIKIINDLEAQRKYIINRLLNKLNNNKFIQLSDILEEYSERTSSNNEFPVLSSTTSGLFFQTEYFNKDASSSDTTGYRIIPKGYCTYRSMSDTGHFTFNQQNIIDIGIISPAYPVFYSKKYMNEFIILYLNNSQDIKKQILELKTGGTRFALSFKTLISFKIPKVDTLTQKKTLKIINSISEKIDNENNIYNYLIKEKSYLLNNMFI